MDKKALVSKIKKLAEQGVGGEQTNAEIILRKIMEKYNITDDDIIDEVSLQYYEITFKGKYERKLLLQVVFKVMNNLDGIYYSVTESGRHSKNKFKVLCSAAQAAEIEYLFEFYKSLLNDELDFFVTSFIQKHRIFGDTINNDSGLSKEDIKRMAALQMGMVDKSPLKPIERK